jgi:hypothetical protein
MGEIQVMSQSDYEAAVAAFIQKRGITRCPTACVVRTQGTVSIADREALQKRSAEIERLRQKRHSRDPLAGFKK